MGFNLAFKGLKYLKRSYMPVSRYTAHDANHNQAHSKHRTTHTQKHDTLPQHQS